MATETQWATSLLDEAAAIVEAEWMRLQQDHARWEHELADLVAELPAPRRSPRRVGVTTAWPQRPRQPVPEERRRQPTRPGPPLPVWACQRSPPQDPRYLFKGTVGQGR